MLRLSILLFVCFLASALNSEFIHKRRGHAIDRRRFQLTKLEIIPEEIRRKILLDNINSQIVLGNYAAPNQFPYYGYTIIHRTSGSSFCGSSLISTVWVTTAAHCLRNALAVAIYFGSIDKENMPVSRSAEGYVVHESFEKPTTLANDIALIKLTSAVPLSVSIQLVQLPAHSAKTIDFSGIRMTSCGFGTTVTEYPRYLIFNTQLSRDSQTTNVEEIIGSF